MKTFASLGLFLLAAAPANAQPSVSPPAANPPAPAAAAAGDTRNDQEQRICREINPTGSRLGTERVCLTRREWRELKRQQD